jgi:hypothetical protein
MNSGVMEWSDGVPIRLPGMASFDAWLGSPTPAVATRLPLPALPESAHGVLATTVPSGRFARRRRAAASACTAATVAAFQGLADIWPMTPVHKVAVVPLVVAMPR